MFSRDLYNENSAKIKSLYSNPFILEFHKKLHMKVFLLSMGKNLFKLIVINQIVL